MKAVVVYAPGGVEQLVYADVPRPVLKEGWSLVRVRGFGSIIRRSSRGRDFLHL